MIEDEDCDCDDCDGKGRAPQIREESFTVKRVKQYLEAEGERSDDLVQFWAVEGGLRTVKAADIIRIHNKTIRTDDEE